MGTPTKSESDPQSFILSRCSSSCLLGRCWPESPGSPSTGTMSVPPSRTGSPPSRTTSGIPMPEPEEEDLEVLGECLTEGTNCPSLDDLHDFVQEEFGYNPSDEEIAMIENCAESWLQQLGVNI